MQIIETADGSIKVIELDPKKWYWFITSDLRLAEGLVECWHQRKDGMIILKDPDATLQIVENADRLQNPDDSDDTFRKSDGSK